MNTKVIAVIVVVILVVAGVGIFLAVRSDNGTERPVLDTELQIYGNANGDWKIDRSDIDTLKEIIADSSKKTKYADSNGDGVIDQKDIDQVQSIIDGKLKIIY
jgi:iron complex transport system substrate-binding protein